MVAFHRVCFDADAQPVPARVERPKHSFGLEGIPHEPTILPISLCWSCCHPRRACRGLDAVPRAGRPGHQRRQGTSREVVRNGKHRLEDQAAGAGHLQPDHGRRCDFPHLLQRLRRVAKRPRRPEEPDATPGLPRPQDRRDPLEQGCQARAARVGLPPGNDGQHGYASSTPASDGKSLFVFFGKSGVFCFDLAGNQVWSRASARARRAGARPRRRSSTTTW